eukprot:scpid31139/ scgid7741/ 
MSEEGTGKNGSDNPAVSQPAPQEENAMAADAGDKPVVADEKTTDVAAESGAAENSATVNGVAENGASATAEAEKATPEENGTEETAAKKEEGVERKPSDYVRQFAAPSGNITLVEEPLSLQTEDDPLYAEAAELRNSAIVKRHRSGFLKLSSRSACFTAKELVSWLVSSSIAQSYGDAVEKCQSWVDNCLICRVDHGPVVFNPLSSVLWRFIADVGHSSCFIPQPEVTSKIVSAVDLAQVQAKIIGKLFSKYLSADGYQISVNYRGIADSDEFDLFRQSAAVMKRVDMVSESALTRSQRLAFFINMYNMVCIAAMVLSGPASGNIGRLSFFRKSTCAVGGHILSMDDIENGVLRANRKGVVALKKQFSDSDARLPLSLATHEPRIHFALVCGARSCPPLRAFTIDDIEAELDAAARDFLASENVVYSEERNELRLSKIMSWFGGDFGNTVQERLQYYADHMAPGEKQDQLKKALENGGTPKISFMKYDWSLNDNGDGAGPIKKKSSKTSVSKNGDAAQDTVATADAVSSEPKAEEKATGEAAATPAATADTNEGPENAAEGQAEKEVQPADAAAQAADGDVSKEVPAADVADGPDTSVNAEANNTSTAAADEKEDPATESSQLDADAPKEPEESTAPGSSTSDAPADPPAAEAASTEAPSAENSPDVAESAEDTKEAEAEPVQDESKPAVDSTAAAEELQEVNAAPSPGASEAAVSETADPPASATPDAATSETADPATSTTPDVATSETADPPASASPDSSAPENADPSVSAVPDAEGSPDVNTAEPESNAAAEPETNAAAAEPE